MLKKLLDGDVLWKTLLLELVGELAHETADDVAAKYTADALTLVASRGLTKPADIVDATLDMVEEKQNWSSLAVRLFLGLRGTTRAEEKAKLATAALAAVSAKNLTKSADIVAATVAVVRDKQDWDSVASGG